MNSKEIYLYGKNYELQNYTTGKTMENVDNRKYIKLVPHSEKIRQALRANTLISRPNF